MTYALAENIHACIDGNRPIFLDLQHDRYASLAGPAEAAFLRLVRGVPTSADDHRLLAELTTEGLLRATALSQACSEKASHPTMTRAQLITASLRPTAESNAGHRSSPWLLARLIGLRLWIRGRRRWRGAQLLLALAQPRPAAMSGQAPNRPVADILASLACCDRLMSSAERCLERSVALAMLLRACGHPAQLVLAVSGQPFAAHCWVQMGAQVLGDRLERVLRFTPIAVL